ncbi:SphA family protein [Enhydrobacter aerosaccus]|uniref:SphA family protein n=1 Tax=Enhydrobacter aerosaccus TaxID=225324 RepID=UPI000A2ED547|nr:transporter [Enhydrobacter aerosaccus]
MKEARADEAGASMWIPGEIASFAAVPADPGPLLVLNYYQRQVTSGATRGIGDGFTLSATAETPEQYVFVGTGYTFADPVLNGRLFLGATFTFGHTGTTVWSMLSGPEGYSESSTAYDSMTGIGDIYPEAELKWAVGPHNFMTYTMVNVPAGQYDPNRIVSLGIGHWAIDAGLGYTFLSPSGLEFSVVAGLTYNFMNPTTQYQSGIDGHVDWAASYSLTENFYLGAVGYFYNQLSPDSGPGALAGPFQSKVSAVGPQIGHGFVLGPVQFELNLRGYKEFDIENRAGGWNVWLTLALSRKHGAASR